MKKGIVAAVTMTLSLVAGAYCEQGRFALVIGNSNYKSMPALRNPSNDSSDIADALRKMNIEVLLVKDASRRQMNDALNAFYEKLKGAKDAKGLFYYAGHGIQYKGINYLVPVDALLKKEFDIEEEAISADKILNYLSDARNRVNVVVLDACRNNPIPGSFRSVQRGLAVIGSTPPETVMLYSTGAGQVASDGEERNSPFAKAFLNNIGANEDILTCVKRIIAEVKTASGGDQIPFTYNNLTIDYIVSGDRPGPRAGGSAALAGFSRKGKPYLLKYDTGKMTEPNSIWNNDGNPEIAVRFTSSDKAHLLTKVQFYVPKVARFDAPFEARVYDPKEDGTPGDPRPIDAVAGKAAKGDEWVTIDLSGYSIIVRGDFFVSMRWTRATGEKGKEAQFIGTSHDNPSGRSWMKGGGDAWRRIKSFGAGGDRNAMIRAELQDLE